MDPDNLILIRAARDGNLPLVRELIASGVDIHTRDEEALSYAAMNGHLDVVRELLNQGADPNIESSRPLRYAAENGHLNVVRELLDRGANVHTENEWPLRQALQFRRTAVIHELLIRGADFNRLLPEDQIRFRHLIPKVIVPQEYYQLESYIEEINETPDNFLIADKNNPGYILRK